MKKIKIEHIQEIGLLLDQGFDLHTSLSLMTSLYSIDFLSYERYEQDGCSAFELITKMIELPLFHEMILFYENYLTLSQAIDESCKLIKGIEFFKSKLFHYMIYPLILIISVFLFSLLTTFYLKPRFFAFYSSFEIEISLVHRILLECLFIVPYLFIFGIVMLLLLFMRILIVFKLRKNTQLEKLIQIKGLGKYIQIYLSIRLMIYFKEFVRNDIPFNEIMLFLKEKTKDPLIESIAYHLDQQINTGKSIKEIIQNAVYFDSYFKVCYELSLSLENKVMIYDNYIQTQINYLTRKLESIKTIVTPCIYLFVGLFIIGIYSLLVIPMTNMISSL